MNVPGQVGDGQRPVDAVVVADGDEVHAALAGRLVDRVRVGEALGALKALECRHRRLVRVHGVHVEVCLADPVRGGVMAHGDKLYLISGPMASGRRFAPACRDGGDLPASDTAPGSVPPTGGQDGIACRRRQRARCRSLLVLLAREGARNRDGLGMVVRGHPDRRRPDGPLRWGRRRRQTSARAAVPRERGSRWSRPVQESMDRRQTAMIDHRIRTPSTTRSTSSSTAPTSTTRCSRGSRTRAWPASPTGWRCRSRRR